MESVKKHFILVHGFCHGAWCWYKLVALLKLAGHHVTALDLTASGINPKQLNEVYSISDYVHPLMEFLASNIPEDEKVILVGHSYAGLCISLAMESFPQKILVAVFVTAYMPHYNSPPGTLIEQYLKRMPMDSLVDSQFTFDSSQEDPPIIDSVIFGPNYMEAKMYQKCPAEDMELAKILVRPSSLFLKDLKKECLLTERKFGSVKRVFVMCEEDKVMNEEFQRWMIENNPSVVDVISIKDAGHMVMLSKPKELCQCLLQVSDNI